MAQGGRLSEKQHLGTCRTLVLAVFSLILCQFLTGLCPKNIDNLGLGFIWSMAQGTASPALSSTEINTTNISICNENCFVCDLLPNPSNSPSAKKNRILKLIPDSYFRVYFILLFSFLAAV
uniref:Uncharacterized protein n=1 Tax=Corvus moneduloides TaxID=1196302 RepID=A0A8U7MY29_CORMO